MTYSAAEVTNILTPRTVASSKPRSSSLELMALELMALATAA